MKIKNNCFIITIKEDNDVIIAVEIADDVDRVLGIIDYYHEYNYSVELADIQFTNDVTKLINMIKEVKK